MAKHRKCPWRWVPVAEAMPRDYDDVVCYNESLPWCINIGYYAEGEWHSLGNAYSLGHVSHWMPIPAEPCMEWHDVE